jgi:hypothetical protein
MTLPKGFGSGGGGGSSSADVERMIGKRVENMTGMITISYLAAWGATFGGTAAGYFYYGISNKQRSLCVHNFDNY